MSVPRVAIVGRPNVGKSSLFNCLAGRRIAIVDPAAGVTRDRISTLIEADDRFFELFDTGGMGIDDVDNLTADVERQIALALDAADVVVFVLDVRTGLVPLDEEVVKRLRGLGKPVVLVANKCDTPELDPQVAEFFGLGFGPPVCVSSHHQRGKQELLGRILELLPADGDVPRLDVQLKVAIVGRRNTGKSTFINQLAQEERVIVSEVPGTTRDSIDVRFEKDGKVILAIDTAGVRKKKSVANDVEFYSLARAERSIRRADVVLLFLDCRDPISRVDKQLAEYILDQHKPAIFVVNKWDLRTPDIRTGEFAEYVQQVFPSLDFVPIAFITAKSGKNVQTVLNLAQNLFKQAGERVGTGDLNRVLRWALDRQAPPMRQNRRPKVYYATQVAASPPTIVLFTNGPELFDNTYLRYLEKTFRDHLPFNDVPIKLHLRKRQPAGSGGPEPAEETTPAKATARPRPAREDRTGRRRRGKDHAERPPRDAGHDDSGLWTDL